jgi:hypothetical protein
VQEFTKSASKPQDLQHVVFARINKTRQTGSNTRVAPGGGCCGSGTQASCCRTEPTDQSGSCCSSQPINVCCNSSSDHPQLNGCTRTATARSTSTTSPSGIDTPQTHHDTATTQLHALQTSQQPESLRSIVFPDGVKMQDCTIFYVGEEGRGLVNLMMEHAENRVRRARPFSPNPAYSGLVDRYTNTHRKTAA